MTCTCGLEPHARNCAAFEHVPGSIEALQEQVRQLQAQLEEQRYEMLELQERCYD